MSTHSASNVDQTLDGSSDFASGKAGTDSLSTWSYYLSQSKPITIDFLSLSTSSGGDTPTGTAIAALADNSGFGLAPSGDPGVSFAGGGHGGGGSGGGGGSPLTQHYGSGALQFDITYDSSVTGSKNASSIETAFGNAIGYFTGNFVPLASDLVNGKVITIKLNVGWGEVDNMALQSNALGESFTNLQTVSDYSQFADILNQSGDVTSVPMASAGDPLTGTHNYVIATAEAKAIGVASSATTDGWVGFSSSTNWYFGSGPQRITQVDFVGIAEHEISEAMGRIAQVGTVAYLNGDPTGASTIANAYTPFDLFRFSGAGTRSLTGGDPGYFSFNSGANALGTFNTTAGGDYGDWQVPSTVSVTAPNDAYDAGAYAGVRYAASTNDTTVVATLGFGKV